MPTSPIGCVGTLLRLFGVGANVPASATLLPKVQINKYFVSNAEADFFRVLRKVVGDRRHVLAQVSLRQLVWFPGNNQSNPGRQIWQNKVAAKTVDFVVCDPAALWPKVAVELDEPSHARAERQTRDEQVEAILDTAGLPIIRVLTSRTYDTRELEAAIGPYLR
jgi:Protein of unknown function (DUF2726)